MVHSPPVFGGRGGHAQAALVQLFDDVLDGGFGFGGLEQGAVGPGGFNLGLQVGHRNWNKIAAVVCCWV